MITTIHNQKLIIRPETDFEKEWIEDKFCPGIAIKCNLITEGHDGDLFITPDKKGDLTI